MERGPAGKSCAEILLWSIIVILSDNTMLCDISKHVNICSFFGPHQITLQDKGCNPTSDSGEIGHGLHRLAQGHTGVWLQHTRSLWLHRKHGRASGPRSKKRKKWGTSTEMLCALDGCCGPAPIESLLQCHIHPHCFPLGVTYTHICVSLIWKVYEVYEDINSEGLTGGKKNMFQEL